MERDDIERMIAGIKKYTDHFGYHLIRRETGPNLGASPFTTILHFDAFAGKFTIKVDKAGNEWRVSIDLKDDLGKDVYVKDFTAVGELSKVAKKFAEELSGMPRNEKKAVNAESYYLDNLVRSTLYLVENDFLKEFQ